MSMEIPDKVYLIGIGGIGMSGLARYFRTQGTQVAGYDRYPTPLTDALVSEGMLVHFDDAPATIPAGFGGEDVLVIRTPAIPAGSALLRYWQDRDVRILKRAEVLGMICANYGTLAVAGTHGKTSVSSMVAHLLTAAGKRVNAFLGGIALNYGSNVILHADADICVVEADEFDRSFLHLHPEHAVITSVDADHLDIYGSSSGIIDGYRAFADQVSGTLILKQGVSERIHRPATIEYGLTGPADTFAENIRVENGAYHFDIVHPELHLTDLCLGMAGRHNVENAVAATSLVIKAGLGVEGVRAGLASFKGIERRFNIRINRHNRVLIDDYAHHPTELNAAISSAREMFPGRSITVVFQPHLYSRTKDFATEFASSLSLADQLVLLDIYGAREEPIKGVSSEWLASMVDVASCVVCRKKDLPEVVESIHPDVLLMLGAGDIGLEVDRIEQLLNKESLAS
jgi:UDP-N-acetylmuramate--alanine ligase